MFIGLGRRARIELSEYCESLTPRGWRQVLENSKMCARRLQSTIEAENKTVTRFHYLTCDPRD